MSGQAWVHKKEMEAVDAAVLAAYNRITEIAESGATLQDAERIAEQLREARENISQAMDQLKEAEKEPSPEVDEEKIRLAYMDMITDAFSDVLDDLKRNEKFDVNLLVDCLQSGLEIMDDKEFFFDDEEDNGGLSPQEIRRRSLGFPAAAGATSIA